MQTGKWCPTVPMTSLLKGTASLAIFLGLLQGQEADQGAQRLKGLSLEQLGDIEVTTASKVPVKLARTPAAVYVITQEDIHRSGATSIPEALRLAPGVEVARIDAAKWSIGIRGFGSRLSRSVLVVIDGRNVYSPLHAGVLWEVQDTLMEDVDRIEIIRGPGATIWGPNAVNGVINIITKKTKDTRGLLASAGGGNEQRFVNFRYGGGNGGNFNYRVYGKTFDRGPEFHRDGKNFDDLQMGQGGFRMDWDLKGSDTLTFQGDLYKGSMGEKIGVANSPFAPATLDFTPGRHSGGNLLSRWTHLLKDGSDLQLQLYYDRTFKHQANFRETRNTVDFDFLHHKAWGRRHEFLYGAGVRVSASRAPMVVPTSVFLRDRRTDELYSAFVQDEIRLHGQGEQGLWLTLGSKFVRTEFSGFGAQPTARLLWSSGRQTWWASATRALRTPSDLEKNFRTDAFLQAKPLAVLRLLPNEKFGPETLLGYETGYRHLLGAKLSVDIAAFHNRYDNLLSSELGTTFTEASPVFHYVIPAVQGNGIYGSTSGFEVAPEWKPVSSWRLNGSYSYLHMDLNKKADSKDFLLTAKSTMESSPHHQVILQSSLDLPGGFQFSQSYRYVSDLPSQLVPSYGTAGVRLGWRRSDHLEFSVVGQNLLQPHHPEYRNAGTLVGIKRNVYGAITWRP